MDIKLDFVPPSVINFVSRQLIGSGFKLYKKEVASVSKGDPDFSKALKDPFYIRVREALYSDNNIPNGVSEQKEVKILHGVLDQETLKIIQPEDQEMKDQKSVSEIEEIQEMMPHEDDDNNYKNINFNNTNSNRIVDDYRVIDGKRQVTISPEVSQALGTLEKVISIFREFGFNPRSLSLSRFTNNVLAKLENDKVNDSKRLEAPTNELTVSQESRISFCSHSSSRHITYAIEAQDQENDSSSHGTHRSSFSFAINEATTGVEEKNMNGELKNTDESSFAQKKVKKHRICCLGFTSKRLID